MDSDPRLSAQLRHLWAASHALAVTSPTVSAHLMTRLLKISTEREIILPETATRHACAACGTIAIPGWNSHVHTSRGHKRKRKSLKAPKSSSIQQKGVRFGESVQPYGDRAREGPRQHVSKLRVMYECRTCGRSTALQIPHAKPKSESSNRVRSRLDSKKTTPLPAVQPIVGEVSSSSSQVPSTNVQPSAPISSQNAGSKKRAKSRKMNSLSGILAAKRMQGSSSGGQGSGGFGLDLMDLMKSG